MTNDPERRGGCACGRVRFRSAGEPLRVGLCHCLTCRKESGSAFNAFAVFPADQVAIEGEVRAWTAPGGDGERCFCPTCGSQVFHRGGAGEPEIEVKLGAFDEPNVFAPSYEAFTPRKEAWLRTDHLTRYVRNRSDGVSAD